MRSNVYPQVNIRFAESVRKPGEQSRLIITAAAGSQVAVTAVDKSVHLLKGGNELTLDDVRLYFYKHSFSLLACMQTSPISAHGLLHFWH